MFKVLRRKDRKADEAAVTELLEKGKYGVLSTVDSDGHTYGVPLSYLYMKDSIYFHGAEEGHKYENIEKNPKVSFCIVGETETLPEKFSVKYLSVIIFGSAIEVQGQEKQEALLGFLDKYAAQYVENGKKYLQSNEHKTRVIKITIEHISGKVRE